MAKKGGGGSFAVGRLGLSRPLANAAEGPCWDELPGLPSFEGLEGDRIATSDGYLLYHDLGCHQWAGVARCIVEANDLFGN